MHHVRESTSPYSKSESINDMDPSHVIPHNKKRLNDGRKEDDLITQRDVQVKAVTGFAAPLLNHPLLVLEAFGCWSPGGLSGLFERLPMRLQLSVHLKAPMATAWCIGRSHGCGIVHMIVHFTSLDWHNVLAYT